MYSRRSTMVSAVVVCLCVLASSAFGAFGGKPPIGAKDTLRRLFAPYDMLELHNLGMNYSENLLDMRVNTFSYTQMNSDCSHLDAWHLQFPDDCGRYLECLAWEDQFSPVVPLELARRLVKGIAAAQIPGTKSYYSFRHRSGGKTDAIFGDDASRGGRLVFSNLGDDVTGYLRVGFRTERAGRWSEIERFHFTDDPEGGGTLGVIRSPRNWHESPYTFVRHYRTDDQSVDFTGRYGLSDEDLPFQFEFRTRDADRLQIVIGEPGKAMFMMVNPDLPGTIELPDRRTAFRSDRTGDKNFVKPGFHYLILRKRASWLTWNYSSALLVMWDGSPERIEALAHHGYGELRFSYDKRDGQAGGRVWLFAFPWVNDRDMEYIHRNAESFLAHGTLIHNGFPTLQMVNSIPTGLSAGAYLLTKYNDPMAVTARTLARNAVDDMFDAERYGMKLGRGFFPAKAAAWLVKTANLLGDRQMAARYARLLDTEMARILGPDIGYDGKGWPDAWIHFNSVKAAWLAYDATGNEAYKRVWERGISVYTIDAKGIYRYGRKLDAPGGMDTYSGALPLGLWGHAGMLGDVKALLNLDVPNGWHHPEVPVRDTFNDAGAGPWSQDDANADYVGYCLRGLNLPIDRKYVVPVGAFPVIEPSGRVTLTGQPILDNPYFPRAGDKLRILPKGESRIEHKVASLALVPGTASERGHLVSPGGRVEKSRRICSGTDAPLVYRFDARGARGAGIDLRMEGAGYRVEVSPDGRRWYQRLDTWSDEPRTQSLDLSFLTGGHDELLKMLVIAPPDDRALLTSPDGSRIEREHCRYVSPKGAFVYRLDLPSVVECRLELLAGNGYRVECSSDGRTWHEELNPEQIERNPVCRQPDVAWLRILDATKYVRRSGRLYLRFSDQGHPRAYGGRTAFLRRLTVYGALKSDNVFVRLTNVSPTKSFALDGITFRKWTVQ